MKFTFPIHLQERFTQLREEIGTLPAKRQIENEYAMELIQAISDPKLKELLWLMFQRQM